MLRRTILAAFIAPAALTDPAHANDDQLLRAAAAAIAGNAGPQHVSIRGHVVQILRPRITSETIADGRIVNVSGRIARFVYGAASADRYTYWLTIGTAGELIAYAESINDNGLRSLFAWARRHGDTPNELAIPLQGRRPYGIVRALGRMDGRFDSDSGLHRGWEGTARQAAAAIAIRVSEMSIARRNGRDDSGDLAAQPEYDRPSEAPPEEDEITTPDI